MRLVAAKSASAKTHSPVVPTAASPVAATTAAVSLAVSVATTTTGYERSLAMAAPEALVPALALGANLELAGGWHPRHRSSVAQLAGQHSRSQWEDLATSDVQLASLEGAGLWQILRRPVCSTLVVG
jgi:hypothetical protein